MNMNPYVTPLYTIFLRSHNRIARQIKTMKPFWNDQRIFKLARKLNTEIYRNIVLNEWSKIVLGENNVNQMIDEVSAADINYHSDSLSSAVSNEFGKFSNRNVFDFLITFPFGSSF